MTDGGVRLIEVLVDESAHKPVYADLAIAAKGKRSQAAPTQEQPGVYASVNNKSVPPPIPPPAAPHKVLYADLSIAAGKRTPKNKLFTEERVVHAAVNGSRKFTTQELIMTRLGGLDIPPPIPPKPKP
uniref:Uncharacterized protein n=1 Tax=Amphimedon queenslandica TaxID=400682 RepID=A0A1X7TE09_AMPQE